MQPSKMQTIKSLFTPTDRRAANKRRPPPVPISVVPPAEPGQTTGALDVTPTRPRGQSTAAHETSVDTFYQQRTQARSQPDLPSSRLLRETAGHQGALRKELSPLRAHAPREEGLGADVPTWPRRNPSTDRLPTIKLRTSRDDLGFAAESGDAVTSLPSLFSHRRGAGSQDTSGSHAVVPDYSSSVTSGFLSRGPSTNSTVRSDATVDFRRQSLEACSVQQDFFLGGMHLTPAQRSQLLVSLPQDIIGRYCSLYDQPWLTSAAPLAWPVPTFSGLEEERLLAGSRTDLDGDSQLSILRASQAVLRTAAGQPRLCRFMRFLLQGEADDGPMGRVDELLDAPALTAPEVSALLEPLHLTVSQAARLKKHCRYIPQRLETHRGFASPVSYKGF